MTVLMMLTPTVSRLTMKELPAGSLAALPHGVRIRLDDADPDQLLQRGQPDADPTISLSPNVFPRSTRSPGESCVFPTLSRIDATRSSGAVEPNSLNRWVASS